MVRFRVSVDGIAALERDLSGIAGRLRSPGPIFGTIADDWAGEMQNMITNRELDLPEPHPVTKAIRRYYGYDSSPQLHRRGDLQHSIKPLSVEESFFEVGSQIGFASLLQRGGQTRDPHGNSVAIQPHPFVVVSDQMIDDATELIADYVVGAADA